MDARARGRLLRWVLGAAVGGAALLALLAGRGEWAAARTHLTHPRWWGVVAMVVAETLSLGAYARAQGRALAVEAPVPTRTLFVVSLANDALALTVPGEPAVSSAYRFAQYRRQGIPAPVAAWAIVTVMVAQAVALSAVLALGVIVALVSTAHPPAVASTVVLLVVVLVAGGVLLERSRAVRVVAAIGRPVARVLARRGSALAARVEGVLARMREVRLSRGGSAAVVSWVGAAWLADAACLVAAFVTVRAVVPWSAVLLAYGLAQILAVLPLAPGGLGLVEGGLAVVLVAYGTPHASAVAAVLAYRLVTYWAAAAAGWIALGLQTRRQRRTRVGVTDDPDPGARVTP